MGIDLVILVRRCRKRCLSSKDLFAVFSLKSISKFAEERTGGGRMDPSLKPERKDAPPAVLRAIYIWKGHPTCRCKVRYHL